MLTSHGTFPRDGVGGGGLQILVHKDHTFEVNKYFIIYGIFENDNNTAQRKFFALHMHRSAGIAGNRDRLRINQTAFAI